MNEEIKQVLLEHTESLTKETVECLFEIIEVLIKNSESKTDDLMILPILPVAKQLVLKYVDEIAE